MSVEPRNGLWNRLLARAEARAKERGPPEAHHYRPLSAGDDHLRASFENSLIYHGLQIETEFTLRLQRPPRKRKAKRKGNLPVAERLRNDRAAAGSPGPTHRTPTGTPARRISKTTPLSRPPIPPAPPLPPIQTTTRAAAARERVLSAVTDDDEPALRVAGPVVELSDSSDDRIFLAQTAKPDGGAVIVLPHFDQAANSNDTSSWEDDAILVGQPPKGQDSDENSSKNPGSDARSPSDVSPMGDVTPRPKLSKRDRTRSLRARKFASSDSSPAPDSDLEKHRNEKDSVIGSKSGQNSGQRRKHAENPNMDTQRTSKGRKEIELLKQDDKGSKKKETSSNRETAEKGENSCTPWSDPLSGKRLVEVFRNLGAKGVDIRRSSPKPVLSSSSPSHEERSTPSHIPSPPVRSVAARRRKPSDISVEDKLFGPLSPLSSPRRGIRSTSESEECLTVSDRDSGTVEVKKRTSPKQRNKQETPDAASQGRSKCQGNVAQETPVRKSPRRSQRIHGNARRVYDLEVISSGLTDLKRAQCEHNSDFTAQNHSGLQRKTVRKSAQRDSSSDAWEDALPIVPINVGAPPKLPRKIQGSKSAAASILNRSSDQSDKTNRKKQNTDMKRRVTPKTLRTRKLSAAEDDSSDQSDHPEYVAIQSARSSLQKRKRRVDPSSRSPKCTHQQNKPSPVQRKQSHGKAKSEERPRQERNAGSSGAVQEILDSDSDVCIVRFSPEKGKGSTPDGPRNGGQRHVIRQGSGKRPSNCDHVEVIKSSSDDSDISPTRGSRKDVTHNVRTSPGVKLPLRLRRSLDLLPNISRDSVSEGLRTAQTGGSLSALGSGEGEDEAVKQMRTVSGPDFPIRIPLKAMKERTRTDRVVTTSDSEDDSDSSFGLSWCGVYTKAQSAAKYGVLKSEFEEFMSKRRSLKRDLENARKEERSGCDRKRSSSTKAALRDLRMKYGRPLNNKEDSKDSSRKKRRRK